MANINGFIWLTVFVTSELSNAFQLAMGVANSWMVNMSSWDHIGTFPRKSLAISYIAMV